MADDTTQNGVFTVGASRAAGAASRPATGMNLIEALEYLPIVVGVLDGEGKVLARAGGLHHLLGATAPSVDAQQQSRWRVYAESGDLLDAEQWPDARAMRGESVIPGAVGLIDDETAPRWIRIATAPMDGGRVILLIQDISGERDEMERLCGRVKELCVEAAASGIRNGVTLSSPDGGQTMAPAPLPMGGRARGDAGGLTPREVEVLRLIAWGYSHKDIGVQLGIAARTVEFHRSSAARKLELKGRFDIVRYALARGWLHA